jgi:hypothetical protein
MSQFITPPRFGSNQDFTNNPSYVIGSTLEIQWDTGRPEYAITLWQQSITEKSASGGSNEGIIYSKARVTPEIGSYNWTVSPLTFDMNKSNVYFFAANNDTGSIGGAFLSHYFNITAGPKDDGEDAASITSSATSTATSTLSSASTTIPAVPASATASGQPGTSTATASLSRTDKIALGMGLGLAIPLLVLFFAIMFYLRRQRRRTRNQRNHADGQWKELSSGSERLELDRVGHTPRNEKGQSNVLAQPTELQGFRFGEVAELPSKRFSVQNQ